jgi:hypothetical protein
VDLNRRMLSGWVGGNPKSEIRNGRAGGIPNSEFDRRPSHVFRMSRTIFLVSLVSWR